MKKELQTLTDALRGLPVWEGYHQTSVSYLSAYRCTGNVIRMPEVDSPYLYLLAAGSMRLHTPSGIMDYVAGQYSISAIDTPASGYVLSFSEASDFLALSISFTLDDVISVVLDMDGDLPERIISSEIPNDSMEKSDENVIDAAARLLLMLEETDRLAYMGKHIKREIIFNALCGSCGTQFLQSIVRIQQAGEIYQANSWIKENFKGAFAVEELAARRNMSVSAFHQKFKSAVGMGPLQCQKRLRLTEARRLMLDEHASVTDASLEVGYESVSQFIRDYKKLFHSPPKDDIQRLRRQLKPRA